MKKFTSKEVNEAVSNLFVDLTPDEMVVTTTEGKGKKAKEVVDEEATFAGISVSLNYYRGLLDGLSIFEPVYPDGTEESIHNRKVEFDTLYAYAEENFPDAMAEFVEATGVESFGTYDGAEADEEEEVADYSEMSLKELRAECKEREIKYTPKMKEDELIALLEESDGDEEVDEEEEEEEATDYSEMSIKELRAECKEREIKFSPKMKEDELIALLEESDGEEEEEEEEETTDYSEMSLSELRAECKERGIKYTPKQKTDDLIALLEEDDAAGEEEEDEEEEETDEVDYSELSLKELRTLCKERGIKFTPKQKEDDLVALLEESDGAEADEEEEEEEEEDGADYSAMSLSELRKECKDRGIKYTPKQKVEDLVALLEEDDESGDEEEDEEDGDDVTEEELDEILDEEFEDETLNEEKEKGGKGKGKSLPKKKK